MAINSEFNLDTLKILLKLHSNKELKSLYKSLGSSLSLGSMTHLELVKSVSTKITLDELIRKYSSTIFAHNTTFRIFKFHNDKSKSVSNGLGKIQSLHSNENWLKLTTNGLKPRSIPSKGKLIFLKKEKSKAFMVFILPGQRKEIVEELKVRSISQPSFSIAVWDQKTSTLELRGQDPKGLILDYFMKVLNTSPEEQVTFNHIKLTNLDECESFRDVLDGRIRRGRFTHTEEDVHDITMVSQPDIELSETHKYEGLVEEEYTQRSAGIDFKYKNKAYTVWVGLTTGSFWIRKGDMSEEVASFVLEKITEAYNL